jgi:hypothetical protein
VGERERQEAEILQQPTPGRERVGGGLSDAQIMGVAAVGVTQKEDREEGVDQQDIFDRMVLFLDRLGACPRISVIGSLPLVWYVNLCVQLGHGL